MNFSNWAEICYNALAAAFLDNQIEIFQLGQVWECFFHCFSAQIACTMAKNYHQNWSALNISTKVGLNLAKSEILVGENIAR